MAFTGVCISFIHYSIILNYYIQQGFDVARGRYDQPEHKIYSPSMQLDPSVNIPESFRRTTLLWHDSQVCYFFNL